LKNERIKFFQVELLKFSFSAIFFLSASQALAEEQLHSAHLPTCESQWKNKNSSYDYSKNSAVTEFGNEGYASFQNSLNRDACKKPWTILVYMQADNDLTPYALLDLYEMEAGFVAAGAPKVGSTKRSDLLVQLDTHLTQDIRRLHIFQTKEAYNPKIKIDDFKNRSEKNIQSPIVERLSESTRKLDPAEDLEDFIKWGVKKYPAERYMVIVWGHGQGWTARTIADEEKVESNVKSAGKVFESLIPVPSTGVNSAMENSVFKGRGFGGLAFDDSTKSFLNIPDLSAVLQRVSKSQLKGKAIDVYASDACLMQMLEVAFEMSSSTRYIVGSTQVQNFLGLPYRRLLTELNSGNFGEAQKMPADADEAYLAALMIPKVFKSSMAPQGLQGRMDKKGIETVTMSALNSAELRNFLVPAMLKLSEHIYDYLKEDPIRSIDVQFVIQNTPSFLGGAQDFGAFLTLLSAFVDEEALAKNEMSAAAQNLKSAITQTQNELQKSVSSFVLGTSYAKKETQLYLLGIRAVSVWLPSSPNEYASRRADLGQSKLAKVKSAKGLTWMSFIDEVYKE